MNITLIEGRPLLWAYSLTQRIRDTHATEIFTEIPYQLLSCRTSAIARYKLVSKVQIWIVEYEIPDAYTTRESYIPQCLNIWEICSKGSLRTCVPPCKNPRKYARRKPFERYAPNAFKFIRTVLIAILAGVVHGRSTLLFAVPIQQQYFACSGDWGSFCLSRIDEWTLGKRDDRCYLGPDFVHAGGWELSLCQPSDVILVSHRYWHYIYLCKVSYVRYLRKPEPFRNTKCKLQER